MNDIEICVCKNSNSLKYIYGNSSSEKTRITKITIIDDNDYDVLFHEGLFNTSDDKNTIILFDDMASVLSPTFIMNFIEKILKFEEMDVFYLNRNCDVESLNEEVYNVEGVKILKLKSPYGIKALLLTPKGKKNLKEVIKTENGRGYDFSMNAYCEKINAYGSNPQFFYSKGKRIYDNIPDREINPIIKKATYHARNKSAGNFLWFIFVVILTIIFSTLLLSDEVKLKSDTKNFDHDLEKDFEIVDKGSGLGPFDGTGDMKNYRIS